MSPLFAKEVRALRPVFVLVLVLSGLSVGSEIWAAFPDAMPLEPAKWLGTDRVDAVMSLILVAIITTAGLLVNEEEHGTLAFLDGLPVSRTRLFSAKIAAASLVMIFTVGEHLAEDAVFGALSRTSISGPFPWRFLAIETGLLLVAAFYVFAAALLMSFLRRWLLLGVGLVAWGFLWLHAQKTPHLGLIDPLQLARPALDGADVLVPWRHVGVQLSCGALLLGLAWWGFERLGGRLTARRGGWARVFAWAGFAAVPVVWIAVVIHINEHTEPPEYAIRRWHPGGEREFGRLTSDRFEFIFREDQRVDARNLAAVADEIHAQVAALFEVPPPPGRIVVDLAGRVMDHAAAQAHWNKVRLPLEKNPTLAEQRQSLGHELTHVFIDQASDRQAAERFVRTRWWHEGLATYVELRYFAVPDELDRHERAGAAAHARKRVRFDELCDDTEWSREHAAELVYPLGRAWSEALVREYGDDAPGRLTRALAHRAVLAEKNSAASWRAALQSCGYDFEAVDAAFGAVLDETVARHRTWIDAIPSVTATLSVHGNELLLRARWEGAAPGKLRARVCPEEPDGDPTKIMELTADRDGVIHIPRSRCPGPAVWYALGWVLEESHYPVFEAWQKGSAP